ncbi:class I SAM-dependent methyltransferase [Leptolyngbya sp. AN02str]|uniref:class I SAM-dependent methyltransferase n=1 Tax=Leptolyngbya sp. AN02str TaxID=3423363 RepID=UPI003D3115D1
MIHRFLNLRWLLSLLLGACLWVAVLPTPAYADVATLEAPVAEAGYEYRALHNPDGIGKFYMGREIAQVMGHRGAAWLERPSRLREEQPDKLIQVLPLHPNDVVADIGAGTGYMTFRLSARVPQGKVYAVDVQREMLEMLSMIQQRLRVANVEPVLGTETDPGLSDRTIDLALMVDAYHEFEYPKEMMEHLVDALKPGGKVALVEYRGENPLILIKGLHKMTQQQAIRELEAVGLVWDETLDVLPQQHIMLFHKPVV